MAVSPIYEAMQYAYEGVLPRKLVKRDSARFQELADKSAPTYEEFLELTNLRGGCKLIAERLKMAIGTIHNMRNAGRAREYHERYCKR